MVDLVHIGLAFLLVYNIVLTIAVWRSSVRGFRSKMIALWDAETAKFWQERGSTEAVSKQIQALQLDGQGYDRLLKSQQGQINALKGQLKDAIESDSEEKNLTPEEKWKRLMSEETGL